MPTIEHLPRRMHLLALAPCHWALAIGQPNLLAERLEPEEGKVDPLQY